MSPLRQMVSAGPPVIRERIVVLGDALAADAVGDVGGGHQVAFVRGVDEDAAGDRVFRVVGSGDADGGDVLAIEENTGDDLLFYDGDIASLSMASKVCSAT